MSSTHTSQADKSVKITLKELAQIIGATIFYPPSLSQDSIDQETVSGIAPLDEATSQQVSYFLNHKFIDRLKTCQAKAMICASQELASSTSSILLIHKNPYAAMALASSYFNPVNHTFGGISPLAYIDAKASVHPSATVYPFAFVDAFAQVGPSVVLYPYSFVGKSTTIGRETVLYPQATVLEGTIIGERSIIHSGAVIGSDGFGFAPTGTDIKKVPQVGNVVIESDVEVGANTTVDRATFAATTLKTGCKLDSQVHVAHNATIGPWTMLCGQSAIAGSATVGAHCITAGKAGVSQGVTLGDRIILGAATNALADIDTPGEYQGHPAKPSLQWRKEAAAIKQLPELLKRVGKLEALLKKIE